MVKMKGDFWSLEEINYLKEMRNNNISYKQASKYLGRSIGSVRSKLTRISPLEKFPKESQNNLKITKKIVKQNDFEAAKPIVKDCIIKLNLKKYEIKTILEYEGIYLSKDKISKLIDIVVPDRKIKAWTKEEDQILIEGLQQNKTKPEINEILAEKGFTRTDRALIDRAARLEDRR